MTKIIATVRKVENNMGLFGVITSKGLAEFIGKEIEFEPEITVVNLSKAVNISNGRSNGI